MAEAVLYVFVESRMHSFTVNIVLYTSSKSHMIAPVILRSLYICAELDSSCKYDLGADVCHQKPTSQHALCVCCPSTEFTRSQQTQSSVEAHHHSRYMYT